MSVYAIAQLWIHDRATYGRYVDRFMGVMKNYKGRVLVADESPVVLEGAWDGNKIVVISFPDEAAFRAWAESPEYLEIAKDRKAGAKSVIVLKRSMNSGFAGIDNPLFYGEGTTMLFGDAKGTLSKLVTEVKSL